VSYPGVAVEVEASGFALPECHAKHIALTDATPAAVTVVLPDLGPVPDRRRRDETPVETIMLSGSAVTPQSAVRIARALRPV
jgi:hypothetical protein